MELDHLKETWRNQDSILAPDTNEEQLLAMLTRQSRSPLEKMKRNLLMELIFILTGFGTVAAYYFISFGGKFNEVSWVYIMMVILFSFYYYRKNKLLNEMQCAGCHVKSNLQRQISMLEKYVKNYLVLGTLLIPVILLFLWFLFYVKLPAGSPGSVWHKILTYPWWQSLLIWLGGSIAFTVPVYFLNKWYVHWLYGKHIRRLRRILNEMGDE